MTTLLNGSWLDGVKVWVARRIISFRFSDDTVHRYLDPRVKASVAMVPFAADFAPRSLAEPRVSLGLVVAARDVNQIPAFHVEAVRRACEPRCKVIMYLPDAGHGAMLSPMPPLQQGSVASYLLSDPPSFDRKSTLPQLHSNIAEFFNKTLLFELSQCGLTRTSGNTRAFLLARYAIPSGRRRSRLGSVCLSLDGETSHAHPARISRCLPR